MNNRESRIVVKNSRMDHKIAKFCKDNRLPLSVIRDEVRQMYNFSERQDLEIVAYKGQWRIGIV